MTLALIHCIAKLGWANKFKLTAPSVFESMLLCLLVLMFYNTSLSGMTLSNAVVVLLNITAALIN